MDINKLNKWADLLLDTGKRNNLISFKDTKSSTVEILVPSADTLFGKIDANIAFEVYDPNIEEDEDDIAENSEFAQLAFDVNEKPKSKQEYLAQYSTKIKKQNQILLYSINMKPILSLRNIDKRAKSFIEETGVNVAYMSFGSIHWKESESSDVTFQAPILLIPIQFDRTSLAAPYFIKSAGDDIIVNPTFSYKLDTEYGVNLPEYNDEGLNEYLAKVENIVKKLNWSVSSECKIGIFSFLKINMYRDLKDNSADILKNFNIRMLLGEECELTDNEIDPNVDYHVSNPLIELHNVVDADSSQIEAIEMAKAGISFVLQGPPGTGKSQTIANIIAECLNDGKKVLFVSEKLAALNVVYKKLRQANLAEFCLELHSHKANKKDVIDELCHTLRTNKSSLSSRANGEIALKEKAQRQLDSYAKELHEQRPNINKSLYQLYESYAPFSDASDINWAIQDITGKSEDYLAETVSLLDKYVKYVPSIGYNYKNNTWYGFIGQDVSYQAIVALKSDMESVIKFLEAINPIIEEISSRYDVVCNNYKSSKLWNKFFHFAMSSDLLTPELLNRSNFIKTYIKLKELKPLSEEILRIQEAIDVDFDKDIYKINGSDYSKQLTRQFNKPLSRLFNKDYKEIKKTLRLCKKNGKALSYDESVSITEKLSHFQNQCSSFEQQENTVKQFLGSAYNGVYTNWSNLLEQAKLLDSIYIEDISFGYIEYYSSENFTKEKNQFETFAKRLDSCFYLLSNEYDKISSCFDNAALNIETKDIQSVLNKLNNCISEIGDLDNWCHFRSLLSLLSKENLLSFIEQIIQNNISANDIISIYKKQFYRQWIDNILSSNTVLSSFSRVIQDSSLETFAEKDKEQFEINKAAIRAQLSEHRPSLDMIAAGSSVSVLLREGEKKRKKKSIRALLSEIGDLIQIIKPCFLMSPLSVSTFLGSNLVHFDVVIFDEASQIFPQDAVGAIYRAQQLIVVGDSKQMPPSNFFNATVESFETDDDVDDVTDFESILDLCSTSMKQLRLSWHYRSEYEELIAFSNRYFYDNNLITFPSSKTKSPGIGIDYYHIDGVFDRKNHTNRIEAEYIVDLIYKNIEQFPNRSLGVVAFSVAQQELIDKLLTKRRQEEPDKEFFFSNDASEAFFIKNLETVQGDERDVIIFSVAYGIDAQGRLLHNFGPLNRAGGERRLNVAVTRAKINLKLVSSMHHTDIDLSRTSSEGAKLLKGYLDFAENGEEALERVISLNSFDQFDSDFELEVCEFLRSKGFTVDTQVGCSGFKIDLGLRRSETSDYVLAIECDGATYHSLKNARDRDRLRQEILEKMGWKFYRIWSTDWFRNKEIEKQRLFEAASKAIEKANLVQMQIEEKPNNLVESFNEEKIEERFKFKRYEAVNIRGFSHLFLPNNFVGMVYEILKIEAPLSEELLLKRTVHLFGRKKITNVVRYAYEYHMKNCENKGILRKNGFLYLKDQNTISFRVPGDLTRDVKYISPEELSMGMLEILKHNISIQKNALYHSLLQQCGATKAGKTTSEQFDNALDLLKNKIDVCGDIISIKQE